MVVNYAERFLCIPIAVNTDTGILSTLLHGARESSAIGLVLEGDFCYHIADRSPVAILI